MSDGYKWQDVTMNDIVRVMRGEYVKARFRGQTRESRPTLNPLEYWHEDCEEGEDLTLSGWQDGRFLCSQGKHWVLCQVYNKTTVQDAEPVDKIDDFELGVIYALFLQGKKDEINNVWNEGYKFGIHFRNFAKYEKAKALERWRFESFKFDPAVLATRVIVP